MPRSLIEAVCRDGLDQTGSRAAAAEGVVARCKGRTPSRAKLGFVALRAGVAARSVHPSIVLQKSFGGDERNFLELLMRFVHGDVRDHIVSLKNDHGPSRSNLGPRRRA